VNAHSLTYPAKIAIGVAVTLFESVISEMGRLDSVEMRITDVIKESVDFDGIRLTSFSLRPKTGGWNCEGCHKSFTSFVV
jgi:hypothetical protein